MVFIVGLLAVPLVPGGDDMYTRGLVLPSGE